MDEQITLIQQSTKTLFAFFIPVHDWIRLHYRWYYKWHTKPYSRTLHWVVLIIFILSLPFLYTNFPTKPNDTKADVGLCGYGAWRWSNPTPVGGTIRSIYSYDSSNIWMAGDGGVVLKWNSSTSAWEQQFVEVSDKNYNGISGYDTQNIWVVGDGGTILKYNGASWYQQTSGTSEKLNGVYALNSTNVWAVGASGTILKYNGTSWSAQTSGTASNLYAVHGSDISNIWAVGDSAVRNKYNSDSDTWTPTTGAAATSYKAVYALDATHIWVGGSVSSGASGTISFYNGASWAVQPLSGSSSLRINSIYATDAANVFALGYQVNTTQTFRYSQLGSWEYMQTAGVVSGQELMSIRGVSKTDIWVAGTKGYIAKYADLTSLTSGISTNLNDVTGVSGTNLWVVGDGGKILESSNGTSWSSAVSGVIDNLNDTFSNGTYGWAVGDNGTVLRSDRTAPSPSWTKVAIGETANNLNGVFQDATNVWVVGDGGTVLTSTDSGNTWAAETVTGNPNLNAVYETEGVAYAVGDGGVIKKNTGGGWAAEVSGTAENLNDIYMTDSNMGSYITIIGNNGTYLQYMTPDWILSSTGFSLNMVGMHKDMTYSWAVGQGTVYVYPDSGGLAWQNFYSSTFNLNGIYAINGATIWETDFWAVGDGGKIVKFDGTSLWTTQSGGLVYTTSNLESLVTVSASEIWAAGTKNVTFGTIAKYNGTSWTEEYSNNGNRIYAIAAADNTHLWAVGNQVILKSIGNGTWTEDTVNIPIPGVLNAITVINSSLAYAFGENGIYYVYNGLTWQSGVALGITVNDIYSVDASNIWTVGEDGTIYKFNGTSWSAQTSGTAVSLKGISATDANHAWAVGANGTILKYVDGVWSTVNHGISSIDSTTLNSVKAIDSSNIWVVGDGGVALKYNGSSWALKDTGTTRNLSAIKSISSTNIWVAGQNHAVLNYTTPSNTTATKLLVALPNQSLTDGTGISGTVPNQKVGVAFDLTTYATDSSNVQDLYNGANLGFITGGNFSYTPSSPSLASAEICGISTASITFNKPGTYSITVQDQAGDLTSATSSSFVVDEGDPTQIYFSSSAPSMTAGTSSSALTLGLKDMYGNIITSAPSNTAISLSSSSSNGRFSASSSGPWTSTLDTTISSGGSSTSFYYLDYAAETSTITATSSGLTQTTLSATTTAGAVDPISSTCTLSASSETANNTNVTITTTLVDSTSAQNKVASKEIVLSSSRSEDTLTQPVISTDSLGQASGSIKSTKSGQATITCKDQTDGIYLSTTPSLTFNPGASAKITLSDYPATKTAGDSFSVKADLKDQYDNIVTNYNGTLSFSSSDSQAILPTSHTYTSPDGGSKTFEGFTLKTSGSQTLTIKDNDRNLEAVFTVSVAPASFSQTISSFAISPTLIKADGSDSITATVTALDAYSNSLSGKEISLTSSRSSDTINSSTLTTDAVGKAVFTLTSKTTGEVTLTAKNNTDSYTFPTKTFSVVSGSPDKAKSAILIDLTSLTANGKDSATINLTLRDSSGNLVPREPILITTSRPQYDLINQITITYFPFLKVARAATGTTITTNDSGQARATISSSEPGTSTITVSWPEESRELAKFDLEFKPVSIIDTITETVTQTAETAKTAIETIIEKISEITQSPAAKIIAKFTEPISQTLATIGLIPLIANVFGTIPQVFNLLSYLGVSLLEFIGIKRKRQPWGRVYNAIDGKPIDLAVVRIFDTRNHLVESRVTDFEGRFGFLVPKGKYTIEVKKDGYKFPSKIAETRAKHFNDRFGIPSDIYLGNSIAVENTNEAITLDVPIDPIYPHLGLVTRIRLIIRILFDWTEVVFSYISKPLLVVGIFVAVFNYGVNSSTKNAIFLAVFIILTLILIWQYYFMRKTYGRVINVANGKPLGNVLISIYDKEYNSLRQTQTTDKLGRFHFLVKPGRYYLSVSAPGFKMVNNIEKQYKKFKLKRIYNGGDIALSHSSYISANILMKKN